MTAARTLVVVPAYRDPGLAATVADALAKAARPSDVRFAICHQFDATTRHQLDRWSDDPRILVDAVPADRSDGVGWARARAGAMHTDEEFALQIDAHCRFAEGWDEVLVSEHEAVDRDRPLLTGRLPGFRPTDAGIETLDDAPTVAMAGSWAARFENRMVPEVGPGAGDPVPFLSAGFVFGRAGWLHDVGADPECVFGGEQTALSLRAYTHGYDATTCTRGVIWHLDTHASPRWWDDRSPEEVVARVRAWRRRLRGLLVGDDIGGGFSGLGRRRTVEAFRHACRGAIPELRYLAGPLFEGRPPDVDESTIA